MSLQLSNGHRMPLTGYGLWNISTATCAEQVYHAIKAGYRCFDGASDYGNEVEAGQGLGRAIADGLITREELFITSKLWPTFHDPKHVPPAIQRQLSDWGLEYFDLYFIHFPISLEYVDPAVRYPPGWTDPSCESKTVTLSKVALRDTWKAMEILVDLNLTRSISVSNFNIQLLGDLLCYARIPPTVLQIEHHPYLTQPRLVDFAQRNGIAVTAYCCFGPQSDAAAAALAKSRSKLRWKKSAPPTSPPLSLLEHPLIRVAAQRHAKTPSQVLLRWATQRGVAVIPKSSSLVHMQQNLEMQWWLAGQEVEAISALDLGLRFNDPVLHGYDVPIFD
ncbi:putative NAD(P)H-dependent D-xylose reductase xyl1 [Aspergillus multicolor]|uniref:putative NAD(P)H-dependent D-xylose reductase xyl1 n=1 Tax=Aspergillus multicolor TaxID=41759 RepID=UPI003CCE08FD